MKGATQPQNWLHLLSKSNGQGISSPHLLIHKNGKIAYEEDTHA